MSKEPNVHPKIVEGEVFYGIGVWVAKAKQYQAPTSKETFKASGCHTEFSRLPIGKMSLEDARKAARRRFGYVKVLR